MQIEMTTRLEMSGSRLVSIAFPSVTDIQLIPYCYVLLETLVVSENNLGTRSVHVHTYPIFEYYDLRLVAK